MSKEVSWHERASGSCAEKRLIQPRQRLWDSHNKWVKMMKSWTLEHWWKHWKYRDYWPVLNLDTRKKQDVTSWEQEDLKARKSVGGRGKLEVQFWVLWTETSLWQKSRDFWKQSVIQEFNFSPAALTHRITPAMSFQNPVQDCKDPLWLSRREPWLVSSNGHSCISRKYAKIASLFKVLWVGAKVSMCFSSILAKNNPQCNSMESSDLQRVVKSHPFPHNRALGSGKNSFTLRPYENAAFIPFGGTAWEAESSQQATLLLP